MLLKASKTVDVPDVSLPTFVFGSSTAALPSNPIILDPERPHDRFLTLETYRQWSKCLAGGLRRDGVQTADRILFISGNSIAWPVVFMGTVMAGGILTGVSPALPYESLLRLTKGLEPVTILADANGIANATRLATDTGRPASKVYLFDAEVLFDAEIPAPNPQQLWTLLLDPRETSFDWSPFTSPQQLAVINYTSGSTGFSKGVMISHRNIVANAAQYIEQQRADPRGPEHGNAINWVMWAPFYHVIGQNQFCVIAPKRGIRNYIMKSLALEPLLRFTEQYRPPVMLMMPPLMIALLSHPAGKKYDLSSVVDVSVGGAPLRQAFIDRFESFMPNPECRVIQGWGMTEITCVVANRNPLDRDSSHCIGELLPNVEVKIVQPDGLTEIDLPNESGEIWVRSPNVGHGYWRDAESTATAFLPGGWLKTGDLGYFDEKQRFYVSDRIQDIIYPASHPGNFVLPTDIETRLLGIAGVKDVGVTAVEIFVGGTKQTVPRGFVVLTEAPIGASARVLNSYNAEVQPHQRLVGGLHILDDIPKLPTGKVNRAALRAMDVYEDKFRDGRDRLIQETG